MLQSTPTKELFGQRLRTLRDEAVLTVHELAQQSGVSEDTITKIENSHRNPRPSTIRKLAAALGIEPQELLATLRRGGFAPKVAFDSKVEVLN